MVVARTSGFDQHMLTRIHGVCHNVITITTETFRDEIVNKLEVPKVSKAEKYRDNRFRFQVQPEGEINIVPFELVNV